MKLKIGILFGGSSREREVSFAGGRTVFDNLDKSLFEPVLLFVDSFQNIVQLDWQYVYKGSIRDFYPPAQFLPDLPHGFQIYAESLNPSKAQIEEMAASIGKIVRPHELSSIIDFAFLALHGTFGEDGTIQGMLEWLNIPYSGSGIYASALGMNKATQKELQEQAAMHSNLYLTQHRSWLDSDENQKAETFRYYNMHFAEKFVIKPANQGSSLGVTVLEHPDYDTFEAAMEHAFFQHRIEIDTWKGLSEEEKVEEIKQLTDLRSGLGLPLYCNNQPVYLPSTLMEMLDSAEEEFLMLHAWHDETEVVIEEMIEGREFSCIVVRTHDGIPLALPPTEIKKKSNFFDYRSKYLPGLSHKETPMEATSGQISEIRDCCVRLFDFFKFGVYARIDGFLSKDGEIFLNDPNTTSGMMPSSFFFHQAAEIGLNPSAFLTFIIKQSLIEGQVNRVNSHTTVSVFKKLKEIQNKNLETQFNKKSVAVIMGGYSYERHISMESGRNIFEKLSSSGEYDPIPVFLTGSADALRFFRIPISVLLKDNADDIRDKLMNYKTNEVMQEILEEAAPLTELYAGSSDALKPQELTLDQLAEQCEGVFIALHGRPGEDGTLQRLLESKGLYFNGSKTESSSITINKFETNRILRENGFLVADHMLLGKSDWLANKNGLIDQIVSQFGLPFIAKPVDDGCSAAVRKVRSAQDFEIFADAIFRNHSELTEGERQRLGIGLSEEFPQKQELLIEKFIDKGNAKHFLEITGGMLTHLKPDGTLEYELFEPSEALAEGEILSLEEKFLAGQGQNLTPSRFSKYATEQQQISDQVKHTLKEVAKTLKVTGYCRIDAFVKILENNTVETWIIEVNSLPGMTPATCIYHQAAINGYKPFDFIKEILNFGEKYTSTNEGQVAN